MRITELLEAIDLNKTVQNYGDKLIDRAKSDHSANKLTKEQLVQLFIDHDPTKNKMYVLWMIKSYLTGRSLNGGIRYIEDLGKAKNALELFTKFKKNLPIEDRDINKVKSLSDLIKLTSKFERAKTNNELKDEEKQEIYKEIKVFYSGEEGKILIPKTKRASCFLGQGTQWCTAATKSDNLFDYYNKEGPLYVILPKDGSKWQFHNESNQLMNINDEYQ